MTRTFPIFYDEPLVHYLLDWLPEVDDYLFPSKSKARTHLGRGRAWQILVKLGKRLKVFISPRGLREQRMYYLAKSGFSPFDIQKYLKLRMPPTVFGHRESWQSLLYVTRTPSEIVSTSGLNPDELRKLAEKKSSKFFPAHIWEKMTDIEKSDFSDASRCLLAGTATPSVMVALRGSEASIKNYYKHVTGTDAGKKTWRQLTQELKTKAEDLGIGDTFVSYLDYYGDAKRNFAQHPNKVFSLREAVTIFMQVVGLVADIYAQI